VKQVDEKLMNNVAISQALFKNSYR